MLERIKKAYDVLTKDSGEASIFVGGNVNSSILSLADSVTEGELIKHYKKSLYVFIGVDKIATVTSSTDFNLFKILNLQGEAQKLFTHPVLDLIYKPNDFQTKTEFMRIFTINMKLSGESFIQFLREGNKITGMVNIRPDIVDVEVVDNGNGPEITYKVHTGGKVLTFNSDEIMHVKFADPENPLRGAGVLRPAYSRITAEQKAMELQKNVFENNGRPDGILSVKGLDSQEAAEKLKKKMKNTFSGKNKDERVAIISSEMTYQQISLSAREMDFIESMKFLRDDILAGLGVPKELVTLEDSGKLSSSGDRGIKLFLEFTVEPILKVFVESLNERMIYPFFSEALLLKHENVVPEDREAIVKESIDLKKAGIISVNQAREQLGYEPVEGADDLAESSTPTIKMDKVFYGRPYLVKRLEERAHIEHLVKEKIAKEFLTTPTPEFKRLYKKAMNSVMDTNIEFMLRETKKYFREQKARMQKKYEAMTDKEQITVSELFNLEEEAEATKRLAMQVFPSMAVRSGNAGLTPIKSFYEKVDDFTIDVELIKMIEERAIFFATSVAGVSYDTIGKIVAQGLADGLGRDVVARNIFNAFEDMTRARAKTIAQTEGTYISNLGTQHAFNKEKLVTGKEWISAKDGRVREEHVRNDGVVVDKDASFPNGEARPGQHSINCRCVIAPVIRQ